VQDVQGNKVNINEEVLLRVRALSAQPMRGPPVDADVWFKVWDCATIKDKVILSKATLANLGFYLANVEETVPPFAPLLFAGRPAEDIFKLYGGTDAQILHVRAT
jgi:hypothetical protein